MAPGTLVGDRFQIVSLAGSGGMGEVYRAVDTRSGEPVALKVLLDVARSSGERLQREARMLAELRHAGIVRYVTHGTLPDGAPWLAMEWLEGEDLAQRLGRGGLTPGQAVALVRRAAHALGVAHQRGIVHRDLKPSNLFLVGGDPEAVKVLDFGVARHDLRTRTLTRAGVILGTVGYMAPEQARGAVDLDARADVFSLGCVLYECLAGVPPFSGDHLVAVLAKVLRDEVRPLEEVRPGLPPELCRLVARLLAKDPAERPASGAELGRELDRVGAPEGDLPRPAAPVGSALTDSERRFATVILMEFPGRHPTHGETISVGSSDQVPGLDALLSAHGATLSTIAGGALLVTLSSVGSARDQASRAAACALRLAELHPLASLAVATGLADTRTGWPVGPAIDAAAALLRAPEAARRRAGIHLSEVTAGLLDARFQVAGEAAELTLVGDGGGREAARLLLGKPTPCVGRQRDLAMLDATLAEVVEEGVSRAVLVTAPPGAGKSRLRQEFLLRVRPAGGTRVLGALADAVGAGSPFVLARALLREAAGLPGGADDPGRLEAYLAARFPADRAGRLRDFLGEMAGVPRAAAPTAEWQAAERDPDVMREWSRRVFAEWVARELDDGPLLVVLDDVQWGDHATVSFLGDALRAAAERPLMVLALGRPEVHQVFPELWLSTTAQELRLAPLGRRACEQLVRAVLGPDVPAELMARIVQRADGNAFFLEELVRRVAMGHHDALPETVLAMVQSRLDELSPEARRVLRAASVLGAAFEPAAVAALLGSDRDVVDWLHALAAGELVEREGEAAWRFRHALVREAAYASLTPQDRTRAHLLAAERLLGGTAPDPLVVAEHLSRGGDGPRAAGWLGRAAELALDSGSAREAAALVDRALALAPDPELHGALLATRLNAAAALDDWVTTRQAARDALERLAPGSAPWAMAVGGLAFAGIMLGDPMAAAQVVPAMLGLEVQPPPSGPYGRALNAVTATLVLAGQGEFARMFLDRVEASLPAGVSDLTFDGFMRQNRAIVAAYTDWDLARALHLFQEGSALHRAAGLPFGQCLAEQGATLHLLELGLHREAERSAHALLELARASEYRFGETYGGFVLVRILIETGRLEEALEIAPPLLALEYSFTPRLVRAALAHGWLATDPERARAEALAVCDPELPTPSVDSSPISVVAEACLALAQPEEALRWADQGLALCAARGTVPSPVLRLWGARAAALIALGREAEARQALEAGLGEVRGIVGRLVPHGLHTAFLGGAATARRLIELGRPFGLEL